MANLINRIFGKNNSKPNVNENPVSSTSQKAQILADLQKGKAITPIDALNDYGCFRLGARIADLKEDGWPIESRWYVTSTGKRVKQYYFSTITEG